MSDAYGTRRAPLVYEMTTHLQAGSEIRNILLAVHGVVMGEVIEFYVPRSYRPKTRVVSSGSAKVIMFPAQKKIGWRWWTLRTRKLRDAVAIERLSSLFKLKKRPAAAEYCPNSGSAQIRANSPDWKLDVVPELSANSKQVPFGI